MKSIALDLDHELESLDRTSALEFKQAMLAMLRLVKSRRAEQGRAPFAERIAGHPAIGTWPADVDADGHVERLRAEWER